MATGDQSDIAGRLKALLPGGWFSDTAPVLNAFLQGIAAAFAWVYGLIAYARLQARIKTATDGFLDLISRDYFGTRLPRRSGESDTAFRARMIANLFCEKATRAGITKTLQLLTGNTPEIFEPWNPQDCGGWNMGVMGYGQAGHWGNLQLPAQFFLKIAPPAGSGVPGIAGWGNPEGAFGIGALEWTTPAMIVGAVTEADIYAAVAAAKAEGVTAWVQIS